ncbi:MAG: hypothetical protein RIQ93_1266 [Verrucomicrobiota bacterium]|jgi:GT2 family glycosyltransferase
MTLECSLVIATMNRSDALAEAFASLATQTHPAAAIVVVDASTDRSTVELCQKWSGRLPLRWVEAGARSSALQRNQGAAQVSTPLVGFMDDDVVLPPATLQKLADGFSGEQVGGVAGRIIGLSHRRPQGLLKCYYRLQAGYTHRDFGGRIIGPAINLMPSFEADPRTLIPAEWLNSTLVLYRRELFERERFPLFDGYSFLEDAHLSVRIGRTHELYFHNDAPYAHNSRPSATKSNRRELARMIVRNQRIVAHDVLGLRGFTLAWKLALHRLFQTVAVIRAPQPGRWQAIRGFWDA